MTYLYSFEYRRRAIELFNTGHSIKAIGEELSDLAETTANETTIRDWVRKHARGHITTDGAPTTETITAAINYVIVDGLSRRGAAELTNVTHNSVARWIKLYVPADHPEGEPITVESVDSAMMKTMSSRRRKKKSTNPSTGTSSSGPVINPVPNAPVDPSWPDDPEELKRLLAEQTLRANLQEAIIHVLSTDDDEQGGKNPGKGDAREWSNRQKTRVIDYARAIYGMRLDTLLVALGIAKSSYCYTTRALQADAAGDADAEVRAQLVTAAVKKLKRRCGYRKVWQLLRQGGHRMSEKIVRRIMRARDLLPKRKRVRKYSSYQGENAHCPPNLLLKVGEGAGGADRESSRYFQDNHQRLHLTHDFHADEPAQVWVTDVTEFSCADGKLYFSPLIDLYDGFPVAWTISTSADASLTTTMLKDGLATLTEGQQPVIHSDRGFHYRTKAWLEIIAPDDGPAPVIPSMSRKGTSGDNAAMEGFFGVVKQELIHGRPEMKDLTCREMEQALEDYLDWYIYIRPKQSLEYRTPAEHRALLTAA